VEDRSHRLGDLLGYAEVGQRRVVATVNRWLPGSIELFTEEFFKEPKDLPPGEVAVATDTITLPGDIPAGVLILSLAVVEEHTSNPVVRLGIKGRAKDGWYPVSEIKVGNERPVGQ
jgi:hypothetical protein